MRRTTIGLIALALAGFGSLLKPANAVAASHCNVSVRSDRPVECKGDHSGPWAWPTPDELVPAPQVDVDLTV
jgi:hypothetical protein